jgi:hypothetical protein
LITHPSTGQFTGTGQAGEFADTPLRVEHGFEEDVEVELVMEKEGLERAHL